ncbi:MAG: hypothetical protein IID44_30475 [Planctomycetes bacterium]|nr:hypothetical protein [Planctomycetota bacterium]
MPNAKTDAEGKSGQRKENNGSQPSSQTPANPGNTISIEIVVIRETHWAAVAAG